MSPSILEDTAQAGGPPDTHTTHEIHQITPTMIEGPTPGILSSSNLNEQWTPQTVVSTLQQPPETNSASPLPFLHIIERLKTNKREGWRRFGLDHAESIADHMYRMSIITLLCPPALAAKLDIAKCTKMALIHDMAESLVGDITPVDGVSKSEKSRRETETMDYLCNTLLGNVYGGISGQHIREIWQEYEDSQTPESKFVHDVDKIELLLQMMEYERSGEGRTDLGEFSHVADRLFLPETQEWAKELLTEREKFWDSHNKTPKGVLNVSEEQKRQLDEYYQGAPNGSLGLNGKMEA